MIRYGVIIIISITFSLLDIVTGYLGAVLTKTVSSSKMRAGLIKKAVLVVVIACSALLQFAQRYIDLGLSIPILTLTCSVIIWMEVTSIMENADKISGGKLTTLIAKIKQNKKED